MNNKNYDIAKIEKELYDAIRLSGVLHNSQIFMGTRPKVDIPSDKDAFIVVSVPSDVIDMNAFGRFIARIDIYARDKNNLKNVTRLSELHDKVFDLLPIITNKYSFDLMGELGDSDSLGYHVTLINLYAIAKNTN
jgi:hypothetical protein